MNCDTWSQASAQVRPLGLPLSITSSTSQIDGSFSQQATVESVGDAVGWTKSVGDAVGWIKSVGDAVGWMTSVGDAVGWIKSVGDAVGESGIVEVEGVVSGQIPHVCGHCSASGPGQDDMYCDARSQASAQVSPLGLPFCMTSSTSTHSVESVGDAVGWTKSVGDAVGWIKSVGLSVVESGGHILHVFGHMDAR